VVELTIGLVWLVARWLKLRRWVLLGDGSYSCVQLGWEVLAAQATLITRLRLDARLFTFSDCLALVRRTIWAEGNYVNSTPEQDKVLISPERLDRLLDQLAATA